jgi:hypothetical protein
MSGLGCLSKFQCSEPHHINLFAFAYGVTKNGSYKATYSSKEQLFKGFIQKPTQCTSSLLRYAEELVSE